jgi:hypothetical protein
MRSVVTIVVVLVLGLVVGGLVAGGPNEVPPLVTVAPTAPPTPLDDGGAQTTTSVPLVTAPAPAPTTVPDPTQVRIAVTNLAGVEGLAGSTVQLLADLGYTDTTVIDLGVAQQPESFAIAATADLAAAEVVALLIDAEVTPATLDDFPGELGTAVAPFILDDGFTVVVVLGTDLAP